MISTDLERLNDALSLLQQIDFSALGDATLYDAIPWQQLEALVPDTYGFQCQACGRDEEQCSASPCEAVERDRVATI